MSTFSVNTDISIEEATTMLGGVQNKVYTQLTSRGFAQPPQPASQLATGGSQPYSGYIPADLTLLTDTELGYYLGMISAWLDYVQVQLAEAFGNLIVAEQKLEFINSKLFMLYKMDENKKRTESERKYMVIADRRYVEAQTEQIYHETYHRYVKAIASGAEQNYTAVSRRISQRQADQDRGKRNTSVNNIPTGPLFSRT